jgi:signal transduction histidine kinase
VRTQADADVLRLRGELRDLVAVSAIPAAWAGREPPAVGAGLADALVALLQPDCVFVRLNGPGGRDAVDVVRGSAWKAVSEWVDHQAKAQSPGKTIVADLGEGSQPCRGVAIPIGVNRDGGLVAAASTRSDFPTAIEELLLSLAANQAATDFRNACLVQERRRAEEELREARDELETKVSERTAELRLANAELSALHRVATLVAVGIRPDDLFTVVAEEVARVVDVPFVSVARYEPDGTARECATFSVHGTAVPSGDTFESATVVRLVRENCQAARIGDVTGVAHEISEKAPRSRLRSVVGSPIVVGGEVWGAVVASSTEPLAEGTEGRLADFTELLATAIANGESREALARLAEEQATLRRMAMLVAEGVEPAEIFSVVSEEVGRLVGTGTAAVLRFEHDPPSVVVAGVGLSLQEIVGARQALDEGLASTHVYRSGRPARVDAREGTSTSGAVLGAAQRLGFTSTVATPIAVEGRLWGTMTISGSAPLPHGTEQRLERFTALVATAIANAESKSALAASRQRIVAASDEARRRIERDLHDGTQQRLVSLALAVRAAEANVPPGGDALRAELSGIASGLADAVAELQELSRGIHPAILSRGGLAPAMRALARRSTIPVHLDITTDVRLPEPIEVAAYFVASEAVTNAAKHSQASRIEMSLARSDGGVRLSILDDGVGGADPARGSGLLGLIDRVEALGGSIRVRSAAGAGTHITARLPLELGAG